MDDTRDDKLFGFLLIWNRKIKTEKQNQRIQMWFGSFNLTKSFN